MLPPPVHIHPLIYWIHPPPPFSSAIAECGDYVAEDYPDHTYLSSYKFVPHQDAELERRIMENHKKHVGQSPAEADLNLLETARRCELYGIKMHPAKVRRRRSFFSSPQFFPVLRLNHPFQDPEGVPLNLAVAHMGVLVFQNFAKINTFSWAKVRKLSFKRKKFLIKLHPESHVRFALFLVEEIGKKGTLAMILLSSSTGELQGRGGVPVRR